MPEWLIICLGLCLLMIGIFFVLVLYQIWRVFRAVEGIAREVKTIIETFEKNISKFNNVIESVESHIKNLVNTVASTLNPIKFIPWETLIRYIESLFSRKKKSKR